MPECYDNVKVLLNILGTEYFNFVIGDNKILRIVFGMQSNSATFSCTWCHATAPYDKDFYFLRTFKSLKENFTAYQNLVNEIGETDALKQAKNFKSVVHASLIEGPDDMEILDKAPDRKIKFVKCISSN